MAEDLSGLQSSLSSIERLTQRLVVLFEAGMLDGLKSTVKNVERVTEGIQDANRSAGSTADNVVKAGKQFKLTAEETDEIAKQAKSQTEFAKIARESQDTVSKHLRVVAQKFNHMVDGSRRISADSRQAANTFASLATTVAAGVVRFEAPATTAAAASIGLLSSGQKLSRVVGHLANTSKNVSQFGLVAGTALSALDVAADIWNITQKKVQHGVDRARKLADLEYSKQEALSQLDRTGKTATEAKIDTLKNRQLDASGRETELYFLEHGPQSKLAKAKIRALKLRVEGDKAEAITLSDNIDELLTAKATEDAAAIKKNELQQRNQELLNELQDVTTKNSVADYEATKVLLKKQEERLASQLNTGKDAEITEAIINGRKLYQQAEIEAIQLDYENRSLALKNSKIYDTEGNVIESAMLAAEQALLDSMASKIRDISGEFIVGDNLALTPQQRNALKDMAASVRAGKSAAIAKTQGLKLGLNQGASAANLSDQNTNARKAIRDLDIGSSQSLSLARTGTLYGSTDPLGDIRAKKAVLDKEIYELDIQAFMAFGDSEATLLALVAEKRRALTKLEKVDAVLARRKAQELADGVKIDQMVRDIGSAEARNAVDVVGRGRISDRRSRQLLAAGGLEGSADLIGVGTQRAEFEKSRALAQKSVDTFTAQYNEAKRQQKSEETVLNLRGKMIDSQTKLAGMMAQQEEVVAKQIAAVRYDLIDDKPSSDRFNRARRMNEARKKYSPGTYSKEGGGSESARLTGDFNEYYRKRHGKLTDEEQDAAKEERRMQLQLGRAKRAISIGSSTRKQRELVDYYNKQKEAQGPAELERIANGVDEANNYLSTMATGSPKQGR